MAEDAAGATVVRPMPPADDAAPALCWHLLDRLESAAIGRRAADGALAIRRNEAAGCVLYGPYLHLPRGAYRLSFRCRADRPRMAAQPVLGVEVIVLSRFQQGWRDFTAEELASGTGSLFFEVAREHAIDGGNEGRFEFRFFHLSNADLAITGVELARLASPPSVREAPRWRLLGRLQRSWRGGRDRAGAVTVRRHTPSGVLLYGGWPYLRLPHGGYRLVVNARAGPARRPDLPVLAVEVLGQSRWRRRRGLTQLARLPGTVGISLARRDITAEDIATGAVALDFAAPPDMALEAGADAPFDIRLYHLGNATLRVDAADLLRLADNPRPAPSSPDRRDACRQRPLAAPSLRPAGRRRVVIVGGFQSETLRQGFSRVAALSERFEARYHYVQLPENLRDFAARDLDQCDILLVQDIQLWNQFPLRDCIRPGAEIIKYPLVRCASLWPFDAWNGPGDGDALAREAPNLTFPYLDGLLGRLRREIPDREARFAAYRSLEIPGLVNYRRLHQLEERRLAAMDRQFGAAIGDFIVENFRKRRIFHTTVRPNWEVCTLLIQLVAKSVGVTRGVAFAERLDRELRNPQVPIHPRVARDLGIRWADERTRYLSRGREITWETYIRSYIDHYG